MASLQNHWAQVDLHNAPDTPNAPVYLKSTKSNFGQEPKRFRDQLNV